LFVCTNFVFLYQSAEISNISTSKKKVTLRYMKVIAPNKCEDTNLDKLGEQKRKRAQKAWYRRREREGSSVGCTKHSALSSEWTSMPPPFPEVLVLVFS